uniref:Uncharacterized protein n=1 Tax=Salix viminalis TaxID=40686 RepID=A0A6N2KSN5_SALVM
MIALVNTCMMKCYKQSSLILQKRRDVAQHCIFTRVSKGITTLTAGTLEFQDIIPMPCFKQF